MRGSLSLSFVVLAAGATVAVGAEPDVRGADVTPLLRALTSTNDHRPWANDLAALTDPDPARWGPAVAALVRFGAAVIPDLERLAVESDPQLRSRVATVLGGIGGDRVAPMLLRLSRDEHRDVAELAVLALSRASGTAATARVRECLASADGPMRSAAAAAVQGNGDVLALPLLIGYEREFDDQAKRAKAETLTTLLRQPGAGPAIVALIQGVARNQFTATEAAQSETMGDLLQAAMFSADPRVIAVVVPQLQHRDGWVRLMAINAAAAIGDARTVESLIGLAASDPSADVRNQAAGALRQITGYAAGPGAAWTLWWSETQGEWRRRAERDALLARLHDAAVTATRSELAAFTPAELVPLAYAALRGPDAAGGPCPWWPALAMRAMIRDDFARWSPWLNEHGGTFPDSERAAWVVLINRWGQAQAKPLLKHLAEVWKTGPGATLARHFAE